MFSLDEGFNKLIVKSVAWRREITFDYVNLKGEPSKKHVEVYDVKDDRFYGYDLAAQKTKTFMFSRMHNIEVGVAFTPRFEQKK